MNISELITAQHLAREAIIYIRQSTPHQMSRESRATVRVEAKGN
ncbi:hypothetical protein [Wolbachia endosymbiont of Atemnus politus]|nr:hypothetical protein [Wolbachia endosymbiont of Atemnus politus]